MNAPDRLNAAIEKLEALRRDGDGRYEWVVGLDDDGVQSIVGDPGDMNLGLFSHHTDAKGHDGHIDEANVINAELIVTLHRTVGAQLAILRSVLLARNVEQNWATLVYTTDALALADAILGES